MTWLRLCPALLMTVAAGCGGGSEAAAPSTTTSTTTSTTRATTATSQTTTTTVAKTTTTARAVQATTATTLPFTPTLRAALAADEGVPGLPDKGSALFGANASNTQLCFQIMAREVGTFTGGHIHRSAQSTSGQAVVALPMSGGSPLARPQTPGGGAPGRSGYGIIRRCVDVETSLLDELLANPGDFTVDVHTSEFPRSAAWGPMAAI